MDLNELFFRYQIALMRADDADDGCERHHYTGQAQGLADEIGALRLSYGADGSATL